MNVGVSLFEIERHGEKLMRSAQQVIIGTALVAAIAALAACFAFSEGGANIAVDRSQLLLGPATLGHGGYVAVEHPRRGERINIPRLVVVGGRVYDEAALVNTYTFFGEVLKFRRPFTCLWDPRPVRWPALSGKMLKMIRAWVDANSVQWDTYVQAHALILTNPIVRALAKLVIKLFAPPQPVKIVRNEEEAAEFARTCCAKTRSYVKKSYADRDSRFGLFSSRLKVGS